MGVGHSQEGEILLDRRRARGALTEHGDVDGVREGSVEVTHVAAGLAGGRDGRAVADVVGPSVLPTGPRSEGEFFTLLGVKHDRVAR